MALTDRAYPDHQVATSCPILRILWLGAAVTFFTYAAGFLKFGFAGRLSVTFPHFFALVIAGIAIAGVMTGRYVIPTPVIERLPGRLIAISMLGVVLSHMFGILKAYDDVWAVRESIKVALGFVTFWCVVATFPSDRKFEERFWLIAVGCSAVAVGILIYRYYFVFNSPYLGSNWGERLRMGRNLLGWYLAMFVTISYAGALLSRHRVLMSAATVILLVATVYTGSRSALGLMGLGVLIVSTLALGYRHTRRDALIGMSTAALAVMAIIVFKWELVLKLVENSELYLRLIDFIASEGGTADVRVYLIERALECFQDGSLLFGSGVKNVVICVGQSSTLTKELVVHNDYLSILADMGITGLACYATVMLTIMYIMMQRLRHRAENTTWVDMGLFASATLAIIYLNLSTAYNSPLLWSMLGFAVVGSKVVNDDSFRLDN